MLGFTRSQISFASCMIMLVLCVFGIIYLTAVGPGLSKRVGIHFDADRFENSLIIIEGEAFKLQREKNPVPLQHDNYIPANIDRLLGENNHKNWNIILIQSDGSAWYWSAEPWKNYEILTHKKDGTPFLNRQRAYLDDSLYGVTRLSLKSFESRFAELYADHSDPGKVRSYYEEAVTYVREANPDIFSQN